MNDSDCNNEGQPHSWEPVLWCGQCGENGSESEDELFVWLRDRFPERFEPSAASSEPIGAAKYEVVGSIPYLVTYPDGRMETVYADKMREIPQLDRIEAMLKTLTTGEKA